MRCIVKNRVGGSGPFGGVGGGFAGIQVAVKAREIAAGNFQADAVAGVEDVAGGPKIDGERIDLAGDERRGGGLGVAILGAEDSLGEIDGRAIGSDVDEFGGEVRVDRGGRSEEFETDGTGDFEIVLERRSGVDEDVVAVLDAALIARAGGKMAARRNRVGHRRWERACAGS